MPDSAEKVDRLLIRIATTAIDNRPLAGEQLAQWIGTTPTPQGEKRLRQLAYTAPRLIATTFANGTVNTGAALWSLTPDADLGAGSQAAMRAATRHLNGEPDIADAIIDAYVAATEGPDTVAQWDVGTAALRLLCAELRDQRADDANARRENPDR